MDRRVCTAVRQQPRRIGWAGAVVCAVALLGAACGTRANDAQIAEALAGRSGDATGTANTLPGDAATDPGNLTTDPGTLSGTGGSSASALGGGASGGSGASKGATGAGSARFTGDNGGATDVGVTATSITAANISIITGPVPGLFAGAVNGTDAFFAYQNSQGGVYNRQLKLLVGDDQFDCGQNRALTQQYMSRALAFVGSFSLYDNCGAQVIAANPNVPDIHNALSLDAQKVANNYPAQPIKQGSSTGPFQWFKDKNANATLHVGSLIGDVQSAKDAWTGQRSTMTSLGYHFDYERLYEPTETDFTSDIQKMKGKVQLLILVAADVKTVARVASAAAQQNWHPPLTVFGASGYDPTLIPLAGGATAVEGDYLYLPSAMYLGEDRAVNPEVDLFLTWLKRTHPNANADLFTVYGWASARLFVQGLQAAGPKVTRTSLSNAMRAIHSYDDNAMLAKADPASKIPPICYVIVQIRAGRFTRADPAAGYRCDGSYHNAS